MKNYKTIYMLCWDIVGCVCEMRVDDLFVDRTSGNSSVAINRLLASSGTHTLSCFIFKPDFNNGKTTHNPITNITNANINVHLEVCSLTLDTNKGEFIDSHTVLSTDINSSKQKMVFDFSVELPYKLDLANNAQIIIARKNNESLVLDSYRRINKLFNSRDCNSILKLLKLHDENLFVSQYWELDDESRKERLDDFEELIQSGCRLLPPSDEDIIKYYGMGRLARFVRPDGTPSLTLLDASGDTSVLDWYFYLPVGKKEMMVL